MKTTLDHRQIPVLLGKKAPRTFNQFELVVEVDWRGQGDIDEAERVASTIDFILKKSHINLDRDTKARAKYLAAVASKKVTWERFVIRVFGAFIMPKRILSLILASMVAFALVYMLGGQYNEGTATHHGLCFSDALYFSGVSFLTIGYADFAPLGPARFLAVIEGLVGVTLMSSFIVALTRKYVD